MLRERYLGRFLNLVASTMQFARRGRTYFSDLGAYPKLVYLELTSACPLSCPMCPRTFMKRKVEHISLDLVEKLARELSENQSRLEYLGLHGFGEATCHPQLAGILKILKGNLPKTRLNVSLNLAAADHHHIDTLWDGGIDEIGVWIDGTTEEVYSKQRVGGRFKKTLEAVDYLLERKRRTGARSPFFHIGMVLTKLNYTQAGEFAAFWKNRMKGLRGVSVRSILGHNFNGNVDETVLLKPRKDWYVYRICAKPFQEVLILADGKICICCYDAEGESAVGSLRSKALKEVWQAAVMKRIRNEFLKCNYEYTMCKNCSSVRFYPLDGRPDKKEYLSYDQSSKDL